MLPADKYLFAQSQIHCKHPSQSTIDLTESQRQSYQPSGHTSAKNGKRTTFKENIPPPSLIHRTIVEDDRNSDSGRKSNKGLKTFDSSNRCLSVNSNLVKSTL